MSRRQAAVKARISPSQWSDIERGRKQAGAGTTVPVHATAATLALMAQIVGVTAAELEVAGRRDAAEQLTSITQEHDLRRRLRTIPGIGALGDHKAQATDGKNLLSLVAASLDNIDTSSLSASAKQELTAMFIDNLVHDATRRSGELALMLRLATEASPST